MSRLGIPSAAKSAFDALVLGSSEWFNWINVANEFQNVLKDKIPWDSLDKSGTDLIQRRLNSASPANQLLFNSFYVTMVAGFEGYLRETIKDLASKISSANRKFEDISVTLQRLHIRESAKLLRRIDSPPDYLNLNENELCRRLGTCVPGVKKVELNAEALAEIEGILKLENFLERASALGKPVSWGYLIKQQGVKDALYLKKENAKAVEKALQDELVSIARYRNRIAHLGGSAADVTSQIVSDHKMLLVSLVNAIEAA